PGLAWQLGSWGEEIRNEVRHRQPVAVVEAVVGQRAAHVAAAAARIAERRIALGEVRPEKDIHPQQSVWGSGRRPGANEASNFGQARLRVRRIGCGTEWNRRAIARLECLGISIQESVE